MRPKTLQILLGHSNIGITMNLYVHLTDDEKKTYKKLKELEKKYNKFEPLERLFSYYLAINGKLEAGE